MAGVYKGNTTGIEAQIKAKRRKKLRQESRQVRGGRNRGMSPFVAASHTGLLWSGTNKNQDISTGPFARPFARSLAPLTHSLAPDCSLCSCPPLRSLTRSLARSLRSHPRSLESELLDGYFVCFFDHSAIMNYVKGTISTFERSFSSNLQSLNYPR